MTTTTTTTKPALINGKYRLYTADVLPFDAMPDYWDGGPSTVVIDGWNMSTTSLCRVFSSPEVAAADDGTHTLGLFRHSTGERHALDGTKYPDSREAHRAAYDAGCLAFMVYEKDAERLGL